VAAATTTPINTARKADKRMPFTIRDNDFHQVRRRDMSEVLWEEGVKLFALLVKGASSFKDTAT
jgi:hypothetical protein